MRKAGITVDLVSRLIQTQFPQWAGLPVRPVETDGWDNATFRLSGQASRVFKHRLPVDPATWTRGRGWAIWKAMAVLIGALDTDPEDAVFTAGVIDKILADHLASAASVPR